MTEYVKPKEVYDYSKEESSIDVQPLTLKGIEKFSIWDKENRQFVREGETIEVDGELKEVDKYIKLTDEQKKRWNRNLKISREIILDGNEVVYDMPPSVDKQLVKVMQTVSNMDKDPLDFEYTITRRKTGSNAWDVEYDVSIAGEKSVSPPEPELTLSEDAEEEQAPLNDLEKQVVSMIKKRYPDYAQKPRKVFIKPIVKNANCTEARAGHIVDEYLLNE